MAALDRRFCPAQIKVAANARTATVAERIFFMVFTSPSVMDGDQIKSADIGYLRGSN
jgi:hypothetical protein